MLRRIAIAGCLVLVVSCSVASCSSDDGVNRSSSASTPSSPASSDATVNAPAAPDETSADTTDDTTADTSGDTSGDTSADTTDDTSAGTEFAGPTPDTDAAFTWVEDSDLDGVEQGTFDVPIDRDNPDDGDFTLAMARHRAADQDQRIGSMLVNPGGPGYGGTDFALFADQIFGEDILDHFDIVAWDPRGTGNSTPAVNCVEEYDPYFALDASPDTPKEQQIIVDAAEEFGDECVDNSGDILPFVSTEATAADMDAIRAALGEDTITYFGFSYGSELGVTWATLYPETVRAMAIDGATDLSVGYLEQNLQQAAGFESTFDTFLDACAQDKTCEFHNDGDPAAAFDELSEQADADPAPTVAGRPDATQGVLVTAVVDAMYDESYWQQLQSALADLQEGDGAGVLALYDDYYVRQTDGTYGNELEAYFAINCLDDPGTKDPDVIFEMQSEFAEVAPRLGASWVNELEVCASWPVPAAPPLQLDAQGAGPIVVVGTTGDPATPLAGTRRTAEQLEDGHLIVATADQHTGYGTSECIDDLIEGYLVDLRVPDDETTCDS